MKLREDGPKRGLVGRSAVFTRIKQKALQNRLLAHAGGSAFQVVAFALNFA